MRAIETVGPTERVYELYSNDPRHRAVKLTLRAQVRPLPEFVKRITNTNVGHGEVEGPFNIWPTANPVISAARGESVKLSLRLRPMGRNAGELVLLPSSGGRYSLRKEASGEGYWLDIETEAISEPGPHARRIDLQAAGQSDSKFTVLLTINVVAENLLATPASLDLGEVELASLKSGMSQKSARLGIRKLIGTFNIRSVSSTLPFLRFDQQTIIYGSNYLIRVSIKPDPRLKPGPQSGVLRIETDDPQTPRVEVPIKVVLK